MLKVNKSSPLRFETLQTKQKCNAKLSANDKDTIYKREGHK